MNIISKLMQTLRSLQYSIIVESDGPHKKYRIRKWNNTYFDFSVVRACREPKNINIFWWDKNTTYFEDCSSTDPEVVKMIYEFLVHGVMVPGSVSSNSKSISAADLDSDVILYKLKKK